MQADIFTSVAVRQELANSHACMPLDFIQANPDKFPGVMDLIDSVGLDPIFRFRRDWNTAAILQFYATCYFHTNHREISWMTGEQQCTATFAQFQKALNIRSSGVRIHATNKEKPKGINDCLCFVRSGIQGDDCFRKANDISIWKQPYRFLYQT